ncbi:cobalt ABC transporter ATP-binding protein [Lysinibacillus contaminans]|uniref:Cobalt ABC transporter ATP-binding protein n=1 Tax=Lysinibacillus contaminans TaxID=1293441 RepID=A0ABR5JZQ0_9BACI|nr:ABC transporter ATP-binding protein [Lysinibacillus contaminans]KOS68104.1 cobalt ABC transporter ATP-binding protein [Lysinibacillus contaminans]
MALLKIDNLNFYYPEEIDSALKNINLTIEEGEFVVLIGQSGCGKSTLLKHLKRELAPHGKKSGDILYRNERLEDLDMKTAAAEVGYVLQNPENQIVTDKVWHELAFGLENLGLDTLTIRRRVAEMANFFGIQSWFRQKTVGLSGGQKQLLNLAAVMAMQPKLLLLDEPTSQLDPIAAMEFITTLHKLNQELGLTIILIEHRLEEVLPLADKVVLMDHSEIIYTGHPKQLLTDIPKNHAMHDALPTAMRIFNACDQEGDAPLTIREGRKWLLQQPVEQNCVSVDENYVELGLVVLEAKDIAFRYEKNSDDILHGFQMHVRAGEMLSIIGGNGTGKSTALKILSGLEKPYRGNVFVNGQKLKKYRNSDLYREQLAVLPQDPKTLFVEKQVRKELESMQKVAMKASAEKLAEIISLLDLQHLMDRHPYDLSGGEQQKLALAKLLLLNPKILLLDEPTKGIDAHAKKALAHILHALLKQGVAIVMVTHDIEFSAEYSSRCALFFDGNLVSEGDPRTFYSGNSFYTTAAHRLSRGIFKNAITCEDVITLCKKATTNVSV